MKEILVLLACIPGHPQDMCGKTYSAYYADNVQLQQMVLATEQKIKDRVGEDNIKYVLPAAFFLGSASATFALHRTITLTLKDKGTQGSLNFNYGF